MAEKENHIYVVDVTNRDGVQTSRLGLAKLQKTIINLMLDDMGVTISEFEQKFGINPLLAFRFEIEKLVNQGLIEIDLNNIILTQKGLDFANVVFSSFAT